MGKESRLFLWIFSSGHVLVGVDGEEIGVTVGDATNKARDVPH